MRDRVVGQVHAVGDELDGDVAARGRTHQCRNGARLAVVPRVHAVEEVGAEVGAGRDRLLDLRVRGRRVAHGGMDAGRREPADEVEAVVALGGERHLTEVAAAELDEALDLGERGVAQEGRVVGAAARLGEPRALEVDAVDDAVVGELGQHRDATLEVARAHRDEAREQTRRRRGRGGARRPRPRRRRAGR